MASLYVNRSKVSAEDIRLEEGTTPVTEDRGGVQTSLTPVNIDTIPASGSFNGSGFQSIREYVDTNVGSVSSSLNSSLSSLENRVTNNENTLQTHNTRITTNSSDIDALEGRVNTIESQQHQRPPDGTLALLQQGTDTTKRIWSAEDLANFSQAFKYDGGALKGKAIVVRHPRKFEGTLRYYGRTYVDIYSPITVNGLSISPYAVYWEDSPSPIEVVEVVNASGISNKLYTGMLSFDDGGGGIIQVHESVMDILVPVFDDNGIVIQLYWETTGIGGTANGASLSAYVNGTPTAIPTIQSGGNFSIQAVTGDIVQLKVNFSLAYSVPAFDTNVFDSYIAIGLNGQLNLQ